ncbi:MAG: hypothetical protein ACI8VW_001268 [bacterium]|jgi:hypothetical protein
MTDYATDVARFVDPQNQACIDNIVKYCGIALRGSKDAALASSSDEAELNTVRDGFARKKLDLDTDAAKEGIKQVCKGNERGQAGEPCDVLLSVSLGNRLNG